MWPACFDTDLPCLESDLPIFRVSPSHFSNRSFPLFRFSPSNFSSQTFPFFQVSRSLFSNGRPVIRLRTMVHFSCTLFLHMLQWQFMFLHAVLFSCCTLFLLHFFNIKKIENERKTENTTKKATLHSAP